MFIKGAEIKLIKGDITELKVEAIVNAANNKLVMGAGVSGAIKKKGGRIIEDEAVKKGPIEIGQAAVTQAGNLACRFVIHAATMGLDFKTDETKIRASARSALRLAEELKIKSIAFPALGCGTGGFPYLACAKILAQEIYRHLKAGNSSLKEIDVCLFSQDALEVFNKGLINYLNHLTQALENGPFSTVDAIIEINNRIVIIERSNPPFGWALPGGFVDYNESLEEAVAREAKEETGLVIFELKQFHTYSAAGRDPRFHTIDTVFISRAEGEPKAGDDAASLKIIKLEEALNLDFAFDHQQILQDYSKYKKGTNPF